MILQIPLPEGQLHYTLQIVLDNTEFLLTFDWNSYELSWYLTLAQIDGTILLASCKVILDFPLLARYRDSRFPKGDIFAYDTAHSFLDGTPPIATDLGSRVQLAYQEESSLGS